MDDNRKCCCGKYDIPLWTDSVLVDDCLHELYSIGYPSGMYCRSITKYKDYLTDETLFPCQKCGILIRVANQVFCLHRDDLIEALERIANAHKCRLEAKTNDSLTGDIHNALLP